MPDDPLLSGFMNHDYVLTFSIADDEQRAKMVALCEGPWQGDAVTAHCWEISNDLSPDDMERAIAELLGEGDRAAYYYLTPPMSSGIPGVLDSKRIFRVVLS
jgi:hypothetical protein